MEWSMEELNYIRFGIGVLSVGANALRHLFDTKYPNLQNYIAYNKKKLESLRQRHILKTDQWNKLFPPSGSGCPSSLAFDSTLLTLLLTNASNVIPPVTGWSLPPPPSDTSEGADILRLRLFRNNHVHIDTKALSNNVFGKMWTELTEVIDRIGGTKFKQELTFYLKQPLDSTDIGRYLQNEMLQLKRERERMLPKRIQDRAHKVLMFAKDSKRSFVVTRGCKAALKSIQRRNCLTITGSVGIGKKTLAYMIASQLHRRGYEIVPIIDYPEFQECYNCEKKQAFLFLHPIGIMHVDLKKLSTWTVLQEDISSYVRSSPSLKLIFVTRVSILNDINVHKKFQLLRENVKNISTGKYALDDMEKMKLIQNYLPEARKVELEALSNPSFPLLCREAKKHLANNDYVIKNKSVTEIFRNEISEATDEEHVILLLVLASNDSFSTNHDVSFLLNKISKALPDFMKPTITPQFTSRLTYILKEMEGTFLSENDGKYRFSHGMLYDILLCDIGKAAPYFILKICSRHFLRNQVFFTTPTLKEIPESSTNLLLNIEYVEAWFDRFKEEVNDGYFLGILFAPSFQCLEKEFPKKLHSLSEEDVLHMMRKGSAEKIELLHFIQPTVRGELGILASDGIITLLHALVLKYGLEFMPLVWNKLKHQWYLFQHDIPNLVKAALINGDVQCLKFIIEKIKPKNMKSHFSYIFASNTKKREAERSRYFELLSPYLPLCISSACRDLHMTHFLVSVGCDVNARNERGETPLLIAAKHKRYQLMEFLIENKSDINTADESENTPLTLSLANYPCTNLLLKHKVDVFYENSYGTTVLMMACSLGSKNVVDLLLNSITDNELKSSYLNRTKKNGVTALFKACQSSTAEIAEALLLAGSDPNINDNVHKSSPLHVAVMRKKETLVSLLLEHGAELNYRDKDGVSPLIIAVENNCENIVKLFLDRFAQVRIKRSSDGATPLLISSERGYLKIVRMILNVDSECVDDQDFEDSTPLLLAALNNYSQICEKLLNKGADVNTMNRNGFNPLLVASRKGNTELIRSFLLYGANINCCTSKDRYTPLHMAAMMGKYKAVQVLLENGADTSLEDRDGHSPLFVAELLKHEKIANLISTFNQYGAGHTHSYIPSIYDQTSDISSTSLSLSSGDNAQITVRPSSSIRSLYDIVPFHVLEFNSVYENAVTESSTSLVNNAPSSDESEIQTSKYEYYRGSSIASSYNTSFVYTDDEDIFKSRKS